VNQEHSSQDIATLPDYLARGLDIVFVGLNPSLYSARLGHYFANPRNRFWTALNRSGLVGAELSPQKDAGLLEHGIGFTDVVKRPTPQASGLSVADYRQWCPVLKDKLLKYQPRIVCFHGLMGYKAYLRYGEEADDKPVLGLQKRTIGSSRIFVVPNPSPANARFSLDDLADWYRKLGQLRDGLLP
jgi:double-stranded uracil-DNA glycosylase